MPSKHKHQECKRCGKRRDDGHNLNRNGYCLECGITRAVESQVQMHRREGPFWDAWVASQLAWAQRLQPTGVPPPPCENERQTA